MLKNDQEMAFTEYLKSLKRSILLQKFFLHISPALTDVSLNFFFVFHSNSMKLSDILVCIDNYNFTNFH